MASSTSRGLCRSCSFRTGNDKRGSLHTEQLEEANGTYARLRDFINPVLMLILFSVLSLILRPVKARDEYFEISCLTELWPRLSSQDVSLHVHQDATDRNRRLESPRYPHHCSMLHNL
ncbi:Protein of unknown function [Cotesia congregata]|uniref:Uncharacterized protein n=1 Tax=Cotesia congregata TaxID=51543 RepID=A0A8J2H9E5_COTCN|nr:Protein of unknown function [Cotesia congregata]